VVPSIVMFLQHCHIYYLDHDNFVQLMGMLIILLYVDIIMNHDGESACVIYIFL
jgi:hypothetical protein